MHIEAKSLCYSRTYRKDYRWIFIDKDIKEVDIEKLESMFKFFYKDRKYFLNQNHLVVHRLINGFAIYKFAQRDDKDFAGSSIFSMEGISFLEDYAENFHNNLSLFISFCLINDICHIETLRDKDTNMNQLVEFPLNSINELINKEDIQLGKLRKQVDKYFCNNEWSAFVIFKSEKLDFTTLSFN